MQHIVAVTSLIWKVLLNFAGSPTQKTILGRDILRATLVVAKCGPISGW